MASPSLLNSVLWNPVLGKATPIPSDHAVFVQVVQNTPELDWFVYIQLFKNTVDQARIEITALTEQHALQINQMKEMNLNLKTTRKLYLDAQKMLEWFEIHGTISTAKIQLSKKIVDVTFFDGTRVDIDPFLIRLRLKLNDNADRFPTESARVQYAVSRLTDKAEQLAQLHIDRNTGTIEFLTLKKFSDWIISEFEDSDKMRNA